VRLKDDITIGLRIGCPVLGSEKIAYEAVTASDTNAVRKPQIRTPGESVHDRVLEGRRVRRGLEKVEVDTRIGITLQELRNQFVIPTGMNHPEMPEIEQQWQCHEPVETGPPLVRMQRELFQRFLDEPVIPGRALAQIALLGTRAVSSTVAQCIIFMVAHDDMGFTGIGHGTYRYECFTDARATVNDIADE